MAPLRSFALYGALCGLTAVSAAPSPVAQSLNPRLEVDLNLVMETFVPPPPASEGPWINCGYVDADCSCTHANGNLKHYCGWVDPTWTKDPSKGHWGRVLKEAGAQKNDQVDVDQDTANPNTAAEKDLDLGDVADNLFAATTPRDPNSPLGVYDNNTDPAPAARRQVNNEIRFRRRHPILVALRMLGFSYHKLLLPSLKCILTRLPQNEQGQFVQGITGTLTEALTVNDGNGFVHRFRRGATFVLRWDVTGYDPVGYHSDSPFQGLHVNLLVDDGLTSQKWGIYQLSTINWSVWPDFIGMYFRIRTRLTGIAGYYPARGWSEAAENFGAQAIAKVWDALINPNDEL